MGRSTYCCSKKFTLNPLESKLLIGLHLPSKLLGSIRDKPQDNAAINTSLEQRTMEGVFPKGMISSTFTISQNIKLRPRSSDMVSHLTHIHLTINLISIVVAWFRRQKVFGRKIPSRLPGDHPDDATCTYLFSHSRRRCDTPPGTSALA